MAKFTISADSVAELQAAYVELFGALDEPVTATNGGAAEADKPRRTRKKAEAPAPINPETATAAPQAEPGPGSNPFGGAPAQEAPGFAPAGATPFSPGPAPAAATEAPVDRPAVARLKEQLNLLAQQHGEAQVYTWAIQKAFNLPATVSTEEFLKRYIHEMTDDSLTAAYHQAGGK